MKHKLQFVLIFLFLGLHATATPVKAWQSFSLPRAIVGCSAGYFRISLDSFNKVYSSKWDPIYSAQANLRFYRNNFFTVQFARYENDNIKESLRADNQLPGNAKWKQEFLNIGVRRYSESRQKWNFFAGFGFTFITFKEPTGLTVFNSSDFNEQTGKGFFLEMGSTYIIFSPFALTLEIEISSAGEGGNPGFMGYSIGGYAFQVGLDLIL